MFALAPNKLNMPSTEAIPIGERTIAIKNVSIKKIEVARFTFCVSSAPAILPMMIETPTASSINKPTKRKYTVEAKLNAAN